MARHRAPAAIGWLRRIAARVTHRDPQPGPADHTVRLDYPDGSQEFAAWRFAGPATAGHEKFIVRVPATARLVDGMVVNTEGDVMLAVEVTDHLPTQRGRHEVADD